MENEIDKIEIIAQLERELRQVISGHTNIINPAPYFNRLSVCTADCFSAAEMRDMIALSIKYNAGIELYTVSKYVNIVDGSGDRCTLKLVFRFD